MPDSQSALHVVEPAMLRFERTPTMFSLRPPQLANVPLIPFIELLYWPHLAQQRTSLESRWSGWSEVKARSERRRAR